MSGVWACGACTYENPALYLMCGMCNTPRGPAVVEPPPPAAALSPRSVLQQPTASPRSPSPSPGDRAVSSASVPKSPLASPSPSASPPSASVLSPTGKQNPTNWRDWRTYFDSLNQASSLESLKEGLQNLEKAYAAEALRVKQSRQRAVLLAVGVLETGGPAPAVGSHAKKTIRK